MTKAEKKTEREKLLEAFTKFTKKAGWSTIEKSYEKFVEESDDHA